MSQSETTDKVSHITSEMLNKLKNSDLKILAAENGLSTIGSKTELIERLLNLPFADSLIIESEDFEEYAKESLATVLTADDEEAMEDGDELPDADPYTVRFYAFDDRGREIGFANIVFWNFGSDGTHHLWIEEFRTDPERRGIGKAVFVYLKNKGFTAETYGGETDEGKGFWEHMYKLGLIE